MDYSFSWKLETICPAIKLYFQWMSRFYFPQWRFLICQRNTRWNDTISINRSINLIIDYFSNRLIDFNQLIVAALDSTINTVVSYDDDDDGMWMCFCRVTPVSSHTWTGQLTVSTFRVILATMNSSTVSYRHIFLTYWPWMWKIMKCFVGKDIYRNRYSCLCILSYMYENVNVQRYLYITRAARHHKGLPSQRSYG